MARVRTYSPATLDATVTLGLLVAAARRERRMTAAELCERVGITRQTLRAIESGAPTVAIGTVFEVATVLAVPLFDRDPVGLATVRARLNERLAVLPQRVRPVAEVDDDF
ncbi:helix-turn-helix transcriptional regulator [Cellulomonas bogoriensis]|uniref:XRE family transcriptional regulator n=1 Tax=Cellulomonas bogoriensis 69B4 = DSM 16987 TaxID=1386082 RepID=A0A0A0BTW6_9CELL|nr:helix-turn-helix transcriptional regulator [Cellulomonas bogoriensis]KGM11400.1 XRE family transcriptional regulator [Cellulomonas bogoriensis 69B4 = DSM 16987]